MKDKNNDNNTVLLTIIAIATLLVAVVGATFAYFNSISSNSTKVTVTTKTKAADIFTSTGSPTINLSITADHMRQSEGNDNHSVIANSADANGNVTVSLKAGSDPAVCHYNLIYTPTTAFNTTPDVANKQELTNKKEYVIYGDSSNDDNDFEDINVAGPVGIPILLKEAVITDNAADDNAVEETWMFTAKFYNLGTDQSANANKTFGGTISIADIDCTNTTN